MLSVASPQDAYDITIHITQMKELVLSRTFNDICFIHDDYLIVHYRATFIFLAILTIIHSNNMQQTKIRFYRYGWATWRFYYVEPIFSSGTFYLCLSQNILSLQSTRQNYLNAQSTTLLTHKTAHDKSSQNPLPHSTRIKISTIQSYLPQINV